MSRQPSMPQDQRKAMLLRTAGQIIGTYGFGRCTLRRVAYTEQVSVPLVHFHFIDRETLLWEVVHAQLTRLATAVSEVAEPGLAPLAAAYAETVCADTLTHKALLLNTHHLSADRRSEARIMQRWILCPVLMALEHRLPPERTAEATPRALSLFALLNNLALWWQPHGPLAPTDYARMATAMVLATPPASRPTRPRRPAAAPRASADRPAAAFLR